MTVWDLIPFVLLLVKVLLVVVTVVFFVSGLDDLLLDALFLGRAVYRALFIRPRTRPLTPRELLGKPEQPIAVMIPAWHEAAVIQQMVDNALHTLVYSDYHVFVGTYPNDPETQREVTAVRIRFPNVHLVVCPHDGPTCKADCLNAVYRFIQEFEQMYGTEFSIVVMEDSEDLPHPLSLKLFNYLIPRKDMVQLPVFPLETTWYDFTSGHYIDEFAESHYKNMIMREALSGVVPSAGVGTAFSRRALRLAARRHDGRVFNTASLTEDYEMGFRLQFEDVKQIFVRQQFTRVMTRQTRTGKRVAHRVTEYVGVRAYFPSSFWASVKQKSRWVLGITMQGWTNLGWRGGLWTKYMLFRDRKSLFTSLTNVLGYVSLVTVLSIWLVGRFVPDGYRYPPLVVPGTWLHTLLIADGGFLILRAFQRAFCVQRVYGWKQALLAVPRQVWGNFINFGAAIRAIHLNVHSVLTGTPVAWGKTDHVFPTGQGGGRCGVEARPAIP